MPQLLKKFTPISNPSRVMGMIDSTTDVHRVPVPRLRLHLADEPQASLSEEFSLAQPPTPQIQQLVDHLRFQQKSLAQREADLQSQVYHWDKQVLATKANLQKRTAELEQHLTQVHCHQSQLMKLQQSLVENQTAIRATVERLIDDCDASELKHELENLKQELSGRFEEILQRWERLSRFHGQDQNFSVA